ncbi:hypothetical protein V496_01375 [Pseudogymnoascus sp. VKM F-4515 (FW-2607)]|nr:hypothetical protein V496_01375 [Pseudogymnoascus sp. VKM F-4515 (FW-2607)]
MEKNKSAFEKWLVRREAKRVADELGGYHYEKPEIFLSTNKGVQGSQCNGTGSAPITVRKYDWLGRALCKK